MDTCACYQIRHLSSPIPGLSRCDGIMRRYPSGNSACDCGDHVVTDDSRSVR